MATTTAPVVQRRMTLAALRKGPQQTPERLLCVGVEAVGKSSFAADAPAPIFIDAEDGLHHLNVTSFPRPQTYADVIEAIETLIAEPHEYKTLVLDTLDAIEGLVWADLCRRHGWDTIEAPGYGKGYVVALDEWRKLIAALERLRAAKGMHVVALAHAAIRTFANPAGQDYSRYEVKLHRASAALWREWVDVALFCTFEEYAQKTKGESRVKGISTGRRVAYTQRTAAYDAKSRYPLPPELPLSYAEYAAARAAGQPASPEALTREACVLLDELAPPDEKRVEIAAAIEAANANAPRLAKIVDRLRTLVSEKESG